MLQLLLLDLAPAVLVVSWGSINATYVTQVAIIIAYV